MKKSIKAIYTSLNKTLCRCPRYDKVSVEAYRLKVNINTVKSSSPTIRDNSGYCLHESTGCQTRSLAACDYFRTCERDFVFSFQMREVGLANAPALIVNASSGEELGSWELSQRMEKTYGQPVVAILWRDALRILSDALPDECKHFGYECVDISQVCFGIARPAHFYAKKAKK